MAEREPRRRRHARRRQVFAGRLHRERPARQAADHRDHQHLQRRQQPHVGDRQRRRPDQGGDLGEAVHHVKGHLLQQRPSLLGLKKIQLRVFRDQMADELAQPFDVPGRLAVRNGHRDDAADERLLVDLVAVGRLGRVERLKRLDAEDVLDDVIERRLAGRHLAAAGLRRPFAGRVEQVDLRQHDHRRRHGPEFH